MPEILNEEIFSVHSGPPGWRKALLINPPVYDAQYWARWSQPAGLLRIASLLKTRGYFVSLIDCMETNAAGMVPKRQFRRDGERVVVSRDDIERPIYHFGSPLPELARCLQDHVGAPPDEVWITSIMTYWWESTRDVVDLVRQIFPRTRILVGGIYPTLASEHAAERLDKADIVFKGEISEASDLWTDLSLYDTLPTYAILTTSRGCPWDCVYCAARALSGQKMRKRSVDDVMAEVQDKRTRFGIRRFGFYEDNALISGRGRHFGEIMDAIIESGLKLDLYAPEGFETRLLTLELARKMKQAGFEKIHLPLETVKSDNNRMWNRRHSSVETFEAAFEAAVEAGFKPRTTDLNVFILFGLPDERIDDVVDSLLYAHATVGSVIPMLFTPVPGTQVWASYNEYLTQVMGFDLHQLNGKLLPFLEYNRIHNPSLRGSDYLQLEGLMAILNQGKVLSRAFNLLGASPVASTFRRAFAF